MQFSFLPSSFYSFKGTANQSDPLENKENIHANPFVKELHAAQLRFKYDANGSVAKKTKFQRDYDEKYLAQLEALAQWKNPGITQAIRKSTMEAVAQRKSETVLPPEVLDPLVNAYHQKVVILERELDSVLRDHQKMAGLIEILLQENQELRNNLAAKTGEMQKLIQTVGTNDGELVMNLKKQNKILNDEINSLLLHFEEARGFKKKYELIYEEKLQENQKCMGLVEQIQFDLEEAKRREMELAEENGLAAGQIKELQEEKEELTIIKDNLAKEVDQLRYSLEKLDKDYRSSEMRRESGELAMKQEINRLFQESLNANGALREVRHTVAEKDRSNDGKN